MKIAAEIDVGKYFSETLCQSPLPLSSPIKKLYFYIKTRTKKLLGIVDKSFSDNAKQFESYKTNPYLKMSLKSKLCKSGSREKFLKSFHI